MLRRSYGLSVAPLAAVLALAVCATAQADPTPILGATRVNPDATVDDGQYYAGAAMDSQGLFVVTYQEDPGSAVSNV